MWVAPQARGGFSAAAGWNRAGSLRSLKAMPACCYLSAIVKVSLIGVDVPLAFWARMVTV